MGHASPSSFEAVLAQIDLREPADVLDARRTTAGPSIGWYIPETLAAGSDTDDRPDGNWPAARYLADAPISPGGGDEAASPAPPSLDPLEIAAELDLAGCPDIRSLRLRRRRFARINHPDKVVSARRIHATLRMTIANRLIDEEIARRRRLIPAA